MIKSAQNAALIVVDVQQAFDDAGWGARNNPLAEQNIGSLLHAWRSRKLPILHIQHLNSNQKSLFNPLAPGFAFKPQSIPQKGEPIFTKTVNSAFIGTGLEEHLRASGITTLVIVGITTDHCVSTTTRMAGNLGFKTYIVFDATATFERIGPNGEHWSAEIMHNTALASLNLEFATVVSTSEMVQTVLHSSQSIQQTHT